MPRRPRRYSFRHALIALALVALAVATFYYGGVLTISASSLRIGYGTRDRNHFDDQPFAIGHPNNYRNQGLNFDFADSHGVIIVTHYDSVVALSVESPATGKPVRYEHMSDLLVDPRNGDRYTTNGLITGVSRDTRRVLDDPEAVKAALNAGKPLQRSLERCYIKLEGDIADPGATLIVDPRHRYLFELNQWSRPYCAWLFEK